MTRSSGRTHDGLHSGLRTGWLSSEKVRRELLETIRCPTPAQWMFRPEAGFWCIGEAVKHLLRAEIGSSKMMRKPIRGNYHGQTVPASAILYTVDLDQYPYGRLQVPRNLVPGSFRDQAELERELRSARARFGM